MIISIKITINIDNFKLNLDLVYQLIILHCTLLDLTLKLPRFGSYRLVLTLRYVGSKQTTK